MNVNSVILFIFIIYLLENGKLNKLEKKRAEN